MPSSPVIGVLAAHAIEIRALVGMLTETWRAGRVTTGRLHGIPVAMVVTGQGPRAAARAVGQFLEHFACEGLVLTGFAGGAQPGLAVGDAVAAETVVDRAGHVWSSSYHGECAWAAHRGRVATLEALARRPQDKRQVGQTLGCVAVDMESSAIAEAARVRRVPWVVARVILDPMEQELAVTSGWHAAGLAVSVAGWGRLVRCVRDLGVARRRIMEIVPTAVQEMSRSLSTRVTRHDKRIVAAAG